MAIHEIVKVPDPVLRRPADPILQNEIEGDEIQTLIADMLETMKEGGGLGIAAPQIGISKRIIIISSVKHPAYPGNAVTEPFALINPTLDGYTRGWNEGFEGCFSIPGQRGWVRRHHGVHCSFYDKTGKYRSAYLEGLLARVFQHENDHLNGVLFIDTPGILIVSEDEYKHRLSVFKDTGHWP